MAAAHGRRRRVALPWPMRLRLCVFEAAIDATQRRDGSVNRFLFSLFDRRAPADPRPDAAGVSSTDITVDASRGLWARVFYSPLPSPRPVVVYFHGGGFTLFSAASRAYDALCRTLCVAAAAAVVVGEERTESERALDGVAPVLNARRSDLSWKAFLPVGADRNHPAAHVVTGDDDDAELNEAFPPAMVVVGGLDPLQDWDRRYAAMLRRKGKAARVVEFPEAIHAFYFFPEFLADDHRKLVGEIRAFVEECIASKQPTAQ
ncbi:hypothetical protein OsI_27071 [Oryza sativa Indica Group]|uniref:Alpha/beta hydrolase fold-3 domain-containing protein n=1 Tax=Oryza sativa subsp. indica TaxID=39946 RepID=B8B544_ORYSI|nr:hypothetical protein OsI_27071 [Oryza sativa Indica Group]